MRKRNSFRFSKPPFPRLTGAALPARMDTAHDSEETLQACLDERADFIARRKPRNEDPWKDWGDLGEDKEHFASGQGYYTALIDERLRLSSGDSARRITLVTLRAKQGDQLLLAPEYDLEGRWTSLDLPVKMVFDLYPAHATCERFHSKLKSDIGLERFPSARFATNAHILILRPDRLQCPARLSRLKQRSPPPESRFLLSSAQPGEAQPAQNRRPSPKYGFNRRENPFLPVWYPPNRSRQPNRG